MPARRISIRPQARASMHARHPTFGRPPLPPPPGPHVRHEVPVSHACPFTGRGELATRNTSTPAQRAV